MAGLCGESARTYLGRPVRRAARNASAQRAAPLRETVGVNGQESAAAIVAMKSVKADGAKGQTEGQG